MTKPDDTQYQKIQYDGVNLGDVHEFAEAVWVFQHPDKSIKIDLGGCKYITMGVGDYLFKDCEGELVVGNPA